MLPLGSPISYPPLIVYAVPVLLRVDRSCESEFSRDWLGRSECYLRTLRFKRSTPSVGTLAICASKLQHYGRCMTATDANKQLGEQFLSLSERCHQQINAHATARWHIQ